jgi:hypothetical protein
VSKCEMTGGTVQNRQPKTGGLEDGSGLVLGVWETQMYRLVLVLVAYNCRLW